MEPSYVERIAARSREVASRRFHRLNRQLLAERVRAVRGGQAHALELGCGHLDFTLAYLVPSAARVVATDIVRRFPEDLHLPGNVTFRIEDACDLSFPDASFDCVIALEVIEHVPDERRMVSEALRVLRPGGKLILTTPNRLRLTALVRYLVGKPRRFPHTYALDPVLGPITHEREFSYRDLQRLYGDFRDQLTAAELHGVWFGVPAWDVGIARPPRWLQRIAFNWHAVMTTR